MRFVKVAAAATSVLLLGAVTSLGSAGAASTGVGTSKASTTVVGVSLGTNGSLLDVRLLADEAQSTIDAKTAAAPEAFSKLTAVKATSAIVDAINFDIGVLESRQPGGDAEVDETSVDLANPGGVDLVGLGNVISGNLNLAKLTSSVDGVSAKSTLTGSLTNTSVAGALLDVEAVGNTLSSASTATDSTSTRAVNVDAITVLDLGALLDGLDISLTDLTPAMVGDLLEELGVDLPGLDPEATLNETIDAIEAQLVALAAVIDSNTGILDGSAGTIIDTLGLDGVIPEGTIDDIDASGTAVQQATALLETLRAALSDLLETALSTLDATALLKLDGVDVSVVTKAADTAENSAATATGKIGAVTVGNISLPEIDLLETAAAINSKVDEITATIDGVLGTIGVDAVTLSGLVDIAVLQKTETVETVNGYNVATAGITGLTATVTPPAILGDLIGDIQELTSVGETITTLGGTLPQLSETMTELEGMLGEGVSALQGGATVNVVDVAGVSEFRASVAPAQTDDDPPLAATGANSMRLMGLGFLLVALGLGATHWFRMPVPAMRWTRRRF